MTAQDEPVQARITAFWSTVASGYEAHQGNVPARDSTEYGAWVEAIKELLPPAPADVLDIATGTGLVALIAAGLGHRVTGIDLSGAMLDEARAAAGRRGLGVAFEITDAVAPTLAAASFDAIISRHFIWTLREPLRALRNWLRLLRPGVGPLPSTASGSIRRRWTKTPAAIPRARSSSTTRRRRGRRCPRCS